MKRDPRLVRLSWDHHHGLVLSRRIALEVPGAGEDALSALYAHAIAEWSRAVLPHFTVEGECLLARLLRYAPASDLVQQTSADHLAIEGLVADMRDATSIEARRVAMLSFGQRLRDHIRWEEAELFNRGQAILQDAELDALQGEVLDRLGPNP